MTTTVNMMDNLVDARSYLEYALKHDDIFLAYEIWEIVRNHTHTKKENISDIQRITTDLIKTSLPYSAKVGVFLEDMMATKTVRDVVQENELLGSVAIAFFIDYSILYCSDKHTAMVLALHL